MATDFAVDNSSSTAWKSGSGDTPVTFLLALNQSTILSKILVTFVDSATFLNATLQFQNAGTLEWLDLQYYAVDCATSFGMSESTP